MPDLILPAFRGRRVLLWGSGHDMMHCMQALLDEIGARIACVPLGSDSEALCRAMQAGRVSCVIVPELDELSCLAPAAQLGALDALLSEAREAGVPLVMLLSAVRIDDPRAALMQRLLLSYADGVSRGLFGDAVSVQCILRREPPSRAACLRALALGARFLSGDAERTGFFTLDARSI